MSHQFTYPLLQYRVIDGDTVKACLDLGFGLTLGNPDKEKTWRSVRIANIDTPEKRTRNLIEKNAGLAATHAAAKWFENREKHDLPIMVYSLELGKYAGRIIGDFRELISGPYLGSWMIGLGFARDYDGGKRKKWTKRELLAIRAKGEEMWPGEIPFVEVK
jgi:micrococcal nuclease